ncbi:hypothetical protein RQP46_005806 [Phenoliferia psychrophenolica]
MASTRACFSSLPVELKANVVGLVARQELNWQHRVAFLEYTDREAEEKAYVNGLQAASLVCKEWNSLANAFIFETLTLKGTTLPLFRHRILRKHGHRFKKAELVDDVGDADDGVEGGEYHKMTIEIDYNLSVLPLLPNLRALTINDRAAYHLFEIGLTMDAHGDDLRAMRSQTIHQLAETVGELNLINFTPAESASFLEAWPRVHQLDLGAIAEDFDLDDLNQALAKLGSLERLSLRFMEDTPPLIWTPEHIAPLEANAPPLHCLRLKVDDLHLHHLHFISTFSATLKHLDLEIARLDPDSTAPLPSLLFPHLLSLRISVNESEDTSTCSQILSVFLSSPLVSLSIADPTCTIHDHDSSEESLLSTLKDKVPTLRHLELQPLQSSEYDILVTFCDGRGMPAPRSQDEAPPTNLLSLPTELLIKIARDVAPHGGRKAGNLRLVCRHLDCVVAPVTWASIVLPTDADGLQEIATELLNDRTENTSYITSVRYNVPETQLRRIVVALKALPALRRLHLVGTSDELFVPRHDLLGSFPEIDNLCLEYVDLDSMWDLKAWAPNVTSLELVNCDKADAPFFNDDDIYCIGISTDFNLRTMPFSFTLAGATKLFGHSPPNDPGAPVIVRILNWIAVGPLTTLTLPVFDMFFANDALANLSLPRVQDLVLKVDSTSQSFFTSVRDLFT